MDRRDPLVPRVALERCAPPGRRLRWVAAALLLTAPSTAQIDRINHHQWSWLMQRRLELLVAVRDRPAEVRDAVAVALTRVDEAVPLLTWARAMALVRGVEADAGFCFRAGLQLMALPEVVSKETFDHVAVTVYAPHLHLTGKLPKPKRFGFEVVVSDASGAVVHRGEIRESEDFSSLREFRTVYKVPTAELADGTYRVRVDTVLEGTGPRPHDVGLEVAFHVLAGYKARAEAFRVAPGATDFVARADEFAPLPRAQLLGAAAGASRPFDGTPGVDPGFAVRDLLRAERILANLGQGRAAFDGLSGYVETALPAGEGEVIYASLRLPPTGLPAPSSWARGSAAWQALARRPLLLMMGRLPSWDVDDRRPSAPRVALPGHLATALDAVQFDRAGRFQVVVLESPGRLRQMNVRLREMLTALPGVLPCDATRMVLVGDGHGASALADFAQEIPDRVRGLVLFNSSGGLATPGLRRLPGVEILAVPGHGRSGARSIGMLTTFAARAGKAEAVTIETQRQWPWSIAMPLAGPEIEAFAARVTARVK